MKTNQIVYFFTILLFSGCVASKMSKDEQYFRSNKNKIKYLTEYDKLLQKSKIQLDTFYIDTKYGKTYIVSCGKPENTPLVLIHGFGASSAMWAENYDELSEHFHVYAIDRMTDINKSILNDIKVRPLNAKDLCDWYVEVLDSLQLDKTSIVAHSYGGWCAMYLSYYYPEKVNKLALLGPMGLVQNIGEVMGLLWKLYFFPNEKNRDVAVRWMLTDNTKSLNEYYDYYMIATACRGGNTPPPDKIKDKILNNIKSETLLLLGENDNPIGVPEKAKLRAEQCIPNIIVKIVPDAGHLMNVDNEEFANSELLNFLLKDESPAHNK